jgi:flagellin-like hook-associated protein FlgL
VTDFPILNSAFRNNILALQNVQTLIDKTTLRLATGQSVNSALDNPQNYFSAQALSQSASDLLRRLDGIGNSISTVQQALNGVESIEELLNLGDSIATDALENLQAPENVEIVEPAPLDELILASNPAAYWRVNEVSGGVADNLGSLGGAVDGTFANGPTLGEDALYDGGETSVRFDGVNDGVRIPDNNGINLSTQTRRTVELTFNADSTAGRQVLYEEGGTVNAFSIYILDGALHVTGRDSGSWGPPDISVPLNTGETYHVAFTFDSTAGDFIGYVNGEEIGRASVPSSFPPHSGDIGIGFMNDDSFFHDGAQSGNGFYFDGRISDVALYNDALTDADMRARALAVLGTEEVVDVENEDFNAVLDQITQIASASRYSGVNLLMGDDLNTIFNASGSSSLLTEGVDFSSEGLGILYQGFDEEAALREIIQSLRDALVEVRRFGFSLVSDLNVLSVRSDFTQDSVNILRSGAQGLTEADVNEEGANLLSLQTLQTLAVTSLALAGQSNNSILNIFA